MPSTALLAASLLVPAARAAPNFEVSKTALVVDRHREALDNGEIVVRVQRTDDLFSDTIDNDHARLLLEKSTHLVLRIQVDQLAGTVNVNDNPLDIASDEQQVLAVKAETYRLPENHDAPVVDPDQMMQLMAQMSPGIVGVEVKLKKERIGKAVELLSSEDTEQSAQALTLRKIGLWIRLVEVEGQEVAHATAVYTPILQLAVMGSGDKVHKIETISIDGQQPTNDALAGLDALQVHSLPSIEDVRKEVGYVKEPAHKSVFEPESNDGKPHHRHEGFRRPANGFFAWLAEALGMRPPARRFGRLGGKGCHGFADMKQKFNENVQEAKEHVEAASQKLETHRVMLENPFSGMMDEPNERFEKPVLPSYSADHERPHPHPHPHGHPHGRHGEHGRFHERHGRCSRFKGFLRRMAIGFVYGIALMGTLLMHPATLLVISGTAAAALSFHVTRRIVKKMRGGHVRLEEGPDGDAFPEEKKVLLEEVVVEDTEQPPEYKPTA